jgi:death on curing protein
VKEPAFLSDEQVLKIHERSIQKHGGTLGIRDRGGLDAAINHPKNVFFYGRGDLFDMAAAYAFHIAEGQCFLDGNKRTAITSALTFLRMNGVSLLFAEERLYDFMMGIAEKRYTKSDLATYLRKCNPQK